MRSPPLGPELRELLAEGKQAELRELLEGFHPKDAAEMLTCLEPKEITQAMSFLPLDVERDMFGYFEPVLQESIVLGSGRKRVQELLAAISSDDRAEFVDSLDGAVKQQLLPMLAREDRIDLLRREKFEDDQVGSILSNEFCFLGPDLTMARALEEVRRQAPSKETVYYSYVLDEYGKLQGFVSLKNLIMQPPSRTVREIMKTDVVSVTVDEDQEEAARLIKEYDLLALPVVDKDHHMVGLITHDDAVDIIEEENTEDIRMIAGITATEDEPEEYLSASVLSHFRGRVTWLAVVAVSFLFIAKIIDAFGEGTLTHGRSSAATGGIIIAFLPLLLATGANVGGQTSALVLRALAMRTLDHTALAVVIWKELRIGLCLCVALGALVFALTGLYDYMEGKVPVWDMGLAISLAVSAHVVTAAVLGALIPLVVSKLGMRPEVFSHPALNLVADTSGVVIYLLVLGTLLAV